jgi:phage shock protein A
MVRAGGSKGDDVNKLTPLALLAAVAALAFPVAGLADDGTPPQNAGDRLARIQERIAKIEARIDAASQQLADKCSTKPAPAIGTDQAAAPSRADRCARAQERLQKAKDRLARLKERLAKWQQNHSGSSISAADRAALGGLQQQLDGLQS